MNLTAKIIDNIDKRWLKQRWEISDFTITEHDTRRYGNTTLVYCDITNNVTGVKIEDIWIERSELVSCLKMYDWGERNGN